MKDLSNPQFKAVCWAFGVMLIVVGWLFTCYVGLSARVQAIADYQGDVNTKLEVIQNDLVWIKEYMKQQDSSIDSPLGIKNNKN